MKIPPLSKKERHEIDPESLTAALNWNKVSPNDFIMFDDLPPLPGIKAAGGDARQEVEERLRRQIADFLKTAWDIAVVAVRDGEGFEFDGEGLRQEIEPQLVTVAENEAMANVELFGEVGVDFDQAVINQAAQEWARQYTYDLVRLLNETTRRVVQDATVKFVETPGMTIGDLRELLTPAFGPMRAQSIAVTETTRAFSQGTVIIQSVLRDAGVDMGKVWRTSADEVVCPVCGPLNGQGEGEWGDVEIPPAHPRCRCWVTLQFQDTKHYGPGPHRSGSS